MCSTSMSIDFSTFVEIFSIIVELSVRTSAFRAAKKAVPPGEDPGKDSPFLNSRGIYPLF